MKKFFEDRLNRSTLTILFCGLGIAALYNAIGMWAFAAVGVLAMVTAKYCEVDFRLNYESEAKGDNTSGHYF